MECAKDVGIYLNINECERDPCKNGGICTDQVANYSCECPGEYMGRNCQYRFVCRFLAAILLLPTAAATALTEITFQLQKHGCGVCVSSFLIPNRTDFREFPIHKLNDPKG
ncbi:hypothetical protein AMECASPLE_034731 [Ameca splendens]|uniref:EGF-like domain-containing protein n=1 Tax=Ameca splendens TaxID=208324 RepID=A0ABV0YUZ4_9TELE